MNYTYYITETLKEFQGTLYKMIEIRVTTNSSKFPRRALPEGLRVSDNTNSVNSFITKISGNQKELISFFTVDAFTNFTDNSKIEIVYGGYDVMGTIENVNVHNVTALPAILETIPHEIADNNWLANIQQ
jgi:hypothetical protein